MELEHKNRKEKDLLRGGGQENCTLQTQTITLDLMKSICCILIVMLHFTSYCSGFSKIVLRSFTAVAVPCFMSISGYLIFYRKEYGYKKILSGSFKKYLIIFLLWTFLYNLMYYSTSDKSLSFASFAIAHADGWSMWYLKVYVQILFIYPLIRAITREKKTAIMYSALWLIFVCFRFSAGLTGIDSNYLKSIELPFFQYSGYIGGTRAGLYPQEALGYFILGGGIIHYLIEDQNNARKKKIELLGLLVGGSGAVVTVLVTAYAVTKYGWNYFDFGLQPYNIWICAELAGFIVLFFLIGQRVSCHSKLGKSIQWFSDKTLGIYVLHIFIRQMLKGIPFFKELEEGDSRNFIVFILIIAICVFIITLLRKMLPKRISKYIF